MPLTPQTESAQINEHCRTAVIKMLFDRLQERPQSLAIERVSHIGHRILPTFYLPRLLLAGAEMIEHVCRRAGVAEGAHHQWLAAHAKLNLLSPGGPIIVGLVDFREI